MDKLTMAMELGDRENTTEGRMLAYLEDAKATIIRRLDPLGAVGVTEVPDRYAMLQVQLAARYSFRAGGEGDGAHSENAKSCLTPRWFENEKPHSQQTDDLLCPVHG